ncbi:hypothetical protein Taro_009810 [Colocasia esculenta]|uniref:SEC7 domain-containing protein n=1 Tax=Colocasia esculenta TaxID=4460 RepID=A0A843U1X1_COLES|nr:hypothetical protein [Colocasia esculenta]
MGRQRDHDDSDGDGGGGGEPADGARRDRRRSSRSCRGRPPQRQPPSGGRLRELGLSCMLNTEVGAVLAVIRRSSDAVSGQFLGSPDDAAPPVAADSPLLQSLKSLRSLIFRQGGAGDWRSADPFVYLGPFLDVVQSDDVPASATGVALSAVLKILKLGIFDEGTPGARDAIHSVVTAITNCRLERTDPASEDAVLMRILQVLTAVLRCPASVHLTDHAVCTVVNTCFQVVQQSASRGDLLQRNARYTMHELIQTVFSRLPEVDEGVNGGEGYSDSDPEDDGRALSGGSRPQGGYGARCMVDIFHFLCSLLNVVEVVDSAEGFGSMCFDEDIQLFALILINSAIELGCESVGRHPKLLRMVQDDLFHHLIHYGTRTSPLVLSMICSTVLNLYHFLRRSLRLQLEAFFTFVLLRTAAGTFGVHLQEVAVEGLISFCRQPTFVIEMYVNYDCDPVRRDIFEEIVRLLCKTAFPVNSPLGPMQVQAFEGLTAMIAAIVENMDFDRSPEGECYQMQISEFSPFWTERCDDGGDNHEAWVDFVRTRKFKKKKVMMAANHFNRDEKKGLEYLRISHLVADPPDAKSLACFFRYTPDLDKNKIGDYLGDPGEFNIQVLHEFAATFAFAGVILDTALRTFLETFRLPGESQKIQRILEAFSERFYDQQSADIFASKDAVFILCYSLIMLNTDQHNPQVKKKMTEDEFIRNNRAINGGKDLPREYLSELFFSISNNAITLFGQSGSTVEMTTNRWVELVKSSRTVEPLVLCESEHRLGRDAMAAVAGPSVAALAAVFEHTEEEDVLQECLEALLSVARISQYGLGDIIDQLLSCFCKFTTFLNPYATADETLFTFTNDVRSRMATLAIFTIANKFGVTVRSGWRNVVDILLKLKRLKLLPPSLMEPDRPTSDAGGRPQHAKSESSGVVFPLSNPRFSGSRRSSGLMGRFSQFLSLDSAADSLAAVSSEFENNMKIIQQCQIGSIFSESSKLPDESLQNLGRSLIFAAAGKGQKFSTPVEEEETVAFCWELLVAITVANIQRFPTFWFQFHDYLTAVAQLPLFSPCPFSEKAIMGLLFICLKLFSSAHDKASEELIFKSINLMWKLDKEILDTCCESIAESTISLLTEHKGAIQTLLGWKTVFHLLSVTGRHPETYDRSVEALISVMADPRCITRFNYTCCIEAAFGFAALKISTPENSARIIDLMADSVQWLIQWHKSGNIESGGSLSSVSTASSSSTEDVLRTAAAASGNVTASLFMKLAEALRKISLVRREEIRNRAVSALRRCFAAAEELDLPTSNCIGCFNLIIFAMVDDLHEKMLEYSRREGSERELRSMEATLKEAMELLAEVFLQFLGTLYQSPGFRSFWLGLLRRMDTCIKADLGELGKTSLLHDLVPELLKKMIVEMKEKEILVKRDGDELWDVTNIQIQWIAPAVKDELFPEDF